jgi:hypothetical protein
VSIEARPYAAIAEEYARDVTSGEIPACKSIRLQCKRFLAELKRQKRRDFPFRFDVDKASESAGSSSGCPTPRASGRGRRKRSASSRGRSGSCAARSGGCARRRPPALPGPVRRRAEEERQVGAVGRHRALHALRRRRVRRRGLFGRDQREAGVGGLQARPPDGDADAGAVQPVRRRRERAIAGARRRREQVRNDHRGSGRRAEPELLDPRRISRARRRRPGRHHADRHGRPRPAPAGADHHRRR